MTIDVSDQNPDRTDVPDVRKSVIVNVPIETAWKVFTERPIEWWPSSHVLLKNPREAITFEPRVGGRYYERASDGAECDWGVMLDWSPPNRLAMTWRIDGRWQMIDNDVRASEIEVTFNALSPDTTEVSLAHVKLWRHGDDAPGIHRALDGPSPGETLENYGKAVANRQKSKVEVNADLYFEVQTFYAKQVRLLDNLDIDGYADTFLEDGWVDHAHRNDKAIGREAMLAGMRAALPRYKGIAIRHWYDHMLIEAGDDGEIKTSYFSLVTRLDGEGKVVFEPTFAIDDVLVRVDGQLITKSRYIDIDRPVYPA